MDIDNYYVPEVDEPNAGMIEFDGEVYTPNQARDFIHQLQAAVADAEAVAQDARQLRKHEV